MATKAFKSCTPPCPRFLDLRMMCLGAENALSAFEGAECEHCVKLPLRTLRSRLALFEESAQASVLHGSGPAAAEAAWRKMSWGSQMDLSAGLETGVSALSQPSPGRSVAPFLVSEARPAASSTQGEGSSLQHSSSEEVDVLCADMGEDDSPSLSPEYEELVEVLTRAVSKLNIEWPAEKQGTHPKSKLDERFLTSNKSPPPRGLP